MRGAGGLKIPKAWNAIAWQFVWGMGVFEIPEAWHAVTTCECGGNWGGCMGDFKFPTPRMPLFHWESRRRVGVFEIPVIAWEFVRGTVEF